MAARNGAWFLAVPVAFAVIALGLSVESLPPGETAKMPRHVGRSSALAPFLRFARLGQNHAEPAVHLKIAPTNAGPLVTINISTMLSDARDFCLDIDLNHDGRFEGPGELAYATGRFDEAGTAELRLHGLIHGRYRARVRVDGIDGEVVSAIQCFELLPPRNSPLPVSFEVNRGQTDSSVLFLGRAKHQMVFVTREETVIVGRVGSQESAGRNWKPEIRSRESGGRHPETAPDSQFVSRFRLAGANSWAQPTGQKMLPGKANYFIGNDPAKWRTDIDTFAEITTDAYPGIRMIHRSSQGRLAYDFRVAPGSNPADIVLDFSDADRLSLNDDGDLIVHHHGGDTIRHSAPLMYQEHRGSKQAVKGDWVIKAKNQAGYVVTSFDPNRELVIDPILYSTYLGGSALETAFGVAVDGAGNAYMVGTTSSANFPLQVPFSGVNAGAGDAFVTKVNAAGTALLYSTYLGGSGGDGTVFGMGIAIDAAGNVYVTGGTNSPNFPTKNPAQAANAGGLTDAFVSKLDPTGSALVYSTYLGGTGFEESHGIAVDATGAAYIIGECSTGFPATVGAFQTTFGGGFSDAFVAKFDPAGAIAWATYLGGSTDDRGYAIALNAGNATVVGRTDSANFPTTVGVYQAVNGGGVADAFVTQLDAAGAALVASTFLGGSSIEVGYGVALDAAGNVFVGGRTDSNNFPTTAGAAQTALGGGSDGFISKLDPALTALIYGTFIGGPAADQVYALAIDLAGNAYVTGDVWSSPGFPQVNPLQAYGGAQDAFVAAVNTSGTAFLLSTYLGGTSADRGYGIAVDSGGSIYAVGTTISTDFPTLTPFQAANGGGSDGYLAKLGLGAPIAGVTISQSGGTTNVTEGGATDTYTIVLNTAPTANVTITINPGTQVTVAPATLTFTPANYNVAQSVTITAVDDALVEGAHTGTITHTSASADAAYNAIVIASVTANITDNDGVPPPPPPPIPGGGINEGSYAGSKGLGNGNGAEGTFGFGRHLMQQPRLKGPHRDSAGTFRVFNVAHQQRAQVTEANSGLGVLGWSLMLLAVFLPTALVYGRRRPA